MPIVTRRAKGNAEVIIDHELCNLCGLCVNVCKGPLYIENDRLQVDQSILFGCIGCGQCAAVCPQKCIVIEGREMSAKDLIDLPPREQRADYEQLQALLLGRRSIRDFKHQEVEAEVIQKILDAVSTAPMGLPPSEVQVLVLQGFDSVKEFASDMVEVFKSKKWLFSPLALGIMRPFIGKEAYDLMKTFAAPLPDLFSEKMAKGEDLLLYGAPLAMYFHASPTSDPLDFAIAGTYAMLAAESLGLGTCMIGTVAPFLKYRNPVSKKYGIPTENNQGIMIIFGYPKYKYTRSIKRSLGGVTYY
ncbi:MAG TPA: 4Fe-4S dicluster domain-containing protein [Gelria sp.]|nr:4Fe-4S dicluster domain-containing protein [Gelria sp.]